MFNVFVYGTLMKDQRAHHKLKGKYFMGKATINGIMYDLGSFPGIVSYTTPPREGGIVHGELYGQLTEEDIHLLDQYEGYRNSNEKQSLYIRRSVKARMVDAMPYMGNALRDAFVYYYNQTPDEKSIIVHGDWAKYIAEREKPKVEEPLIVAPV
jgi:gamma-glutamylcyclotransferase (GGCT)/AIG2-like uncharacterized protein YtfP